MAEEFQSKIDTLCIDRDYSNHRTHQFQRGEAVGNLIACLHEARSQRDQAIVARNVVIDQQRALLAERDEARIQRNEVRSHLEQALIAKDDALHQRTLASAERDRAHAQRDEARMQLDQAISDQRGVVHHQIEACERYRIMDVDGTLTIRVACAAADEKVVSILSRPKSVDITIRGIEADIAAEHPARAGFHKELRFEQDMDGIYSCSSCRVRDSILTVVLERIVSQKSQVTRGGNESPVGRLTLGATGRETEQSSSISSSSRQMTYNRERSMPRAHTMNRIAETPVLEVEEARESGMPYAIVDDGLIDTSSSMSETGSFASNI
eukprot:TRINITY_DN8058_c1_g1_i3.p1 TRINITY_DN8058_c1_g1~~TRINITY_DN8058_c1_g1_i3.p1  ORF type:complete len:353 (-),score=40.33 TRINITY_DN8058_c1_g1_i3:191-1162(-)